MRQAMKIISTYTGDTSGVCSALYELGGMSVIDDPSGCNSTYNTHDEPRWYDMDSMVFVTGLTEREAVMGDDERIIHDIVESANSLHPKFIAICGSPIPMVVGTDLPAMAREVEAKTKIPCFGLQTNGMHSYLSGVSLAWCAYADRAVKRDGRKKQPRSVNIIGMTPLDFSVNGSVESLEQLLSDHGYTILSNWAMGKNTKNLAESGNAAVNLVVSSDGIELATKFKRWFDTPFVTGVPYGKVGEEAIVQALRDAEATGNDLSPMDWERGGDATIIGEEVSVSSFAHAYGRAIDVITPMGKNGIKGEEEIAKAIAQKKVFFADPLYKPLVPDTCRFVPLPSEGFSGRLFRRMIPNLIGSRFDQFIGGIR